MRACAVNIADSFPSSALPMKLRSSLSFAASSAIPQGRELVAARTCLSLTDDSEHCHGDSTVTIRGMRELPVTDGSESSLFECSPRRHTEAPAFRKQLD